MLIKRSLRGMTNQHFPLVFRELVYVAFSDNSEHCRLHLAGNGLGPYHVLDYFYCIRRVCILICFFTNDFFMFSQKNGFAKKIGKNGTIINLKRFVLKYERKTF